MLPRRRTKDSFPGFLSWDGIACPGSVCIGLAPVFVLLVLPIIWAPCHQEGVHVPEGFGHDYSWRLNTSFSPGQSSPVHPGKRGASQPHVHGPSSLSSVSAHELHRYIGSMTYPAFHQDNSPAVAHHHSRDRPL